MRDPNSNIYFAYALHFGQEPVLDDPVLDAWHELRMRPYKGLVERAIGMVLGATLGVFTQVPYTSTGWTPLALRVETKYTRERPFVEDLEERVEPTSS